MLRLPARAIAIGAAIAALLGLAAPSAHATQATGGSQAASSKMRTATTTSTDLSRATIRAVQRKLGVRADGALGPQTRRAIRRFQRREGLEVDGRLRTATLSALGVEARESSAPARDSSPEQSSRVRAHLARIAACESGGDPTAVSPDGRYRGKFQFLRSTWESLGGEGDPADAPESEQDLRAAALYERQGPSAWPTCSKK
jgi:peptidoglycan hydrolase-like protein with peptidoglycan-binding domain